MQPSISATTQPLVVPAISDYWPGQGGIYAGLVRGEDGAADHHLIVSAARPSTRLEWSAAMEWAKTVREDGRADFLLPTKRESEILYANLQDHFEREWYWTGTQDSSDNAWSQSFEYGLSDIDDKGLEHWAVAVRRLPLQVGFEDQPDESLVILRSILAQIQGARSDMKSLSLTLAVAS